MRVNLPKSGTSRYDIAVLIASMHSHIVCKVQPFLFIVTKTDDGVQGFDTTWCRHFAGTQCFVIVIGSETMVPHRRTIELCQRAEDVRIVVEHQGTQVSAICFSRNRSTPASNISVGSSENVNAWFCQVRCVRRAWWQSLPEG
ncbi:MAG: hypothetical protein MK110_01345 [Fuerstiella sp.]|nr:hypothetical protein [Fuerstiella sp.]